MPSEMQLRVAEEIMNTEREMTGCYARRFEDLKPESQTHYLMLALAAMRAMCEPNTRMLAAAQTAWRDDPEKRTSTLWTAMLDAEIAAAEEPSHG